MAIGEAKRYILEGVKALIIAGIYASIGMYASIKVMNADIKHLQSEVTENKGLMWNNRARLETNYSELLNTIHKQNIEVAEIKIRLIPMEQYLERRGVTLNNKSKSDIVGDIAK